MICELNKFDVHTRKTTCPIFDKLWIEQMKIQLCERLASKSPYRSIVSNAESNKYKAGWIDSSV